MVSEILCVKNISVWDEAKTVLVNNISFSLTSGEFVGLAGESGSGKTLTIKAILGILPQGLHWKCEKLEMDGADLLAMKTKQRRRFIGKTIGFVPQNTSQYLHPMLTIREQMTDGWKNKQEAEGNALEWLQKVGFEDAAQVLQSYSWQFSGGMRQRVLIAMAMMHRPPLFIADEPTAALDSAVQKQVTDVIAKMHQETGMATLFVSHNLGLLKKYSNRILVFYAGQKVEDGLTENVFLSPRHPYTKALINVVPAFNTNKGQRLKEIPGAVPETGRDRQGCMFYERCPIGKEICQKQAEEKAEGAWQWKCNF